MAKVYVSCADEDIDLSVRIKDWLKFQDYEPVVLGEETRSNRGDMAGWHRDLAQVLENCDLVLLVLTPEWVASKWCFAEYTKAFSTGKTIVAVIEQQLEEPFSEKGISIFDLTSQREQALSQLADTLRSFLPNASGFIDFDPERPIYPGLKAYDQEDSGFFFCRDYEIRSIIDRLNIRRRQGGARLLALLGAPGTGISSLLKGGVLPRISRDQAAWITLPVIRPSFHPIDELAKSISTLLGNYDVWNEWANLLKGHDFKGVARELAEQLRVRFDAKDAHILLPIDQSEELFSLSDPEQAGHFLDILGAIFDDDMPYVGVAAIRLDFLEDFQTADQLSHIIEEFSPRLMPLSTIREIITGPSRFASLEIEEELVERILTDAEREGALPLVSLILNYLSSKSRDSLTLSAYEQIGTEYAGLTPLGNLIAKLAEEIFSEEQPNETQMEVLEDMFTTQLVSRDADNRYVLRPAPLGDFNLKTRVLIRKFIESGLLTLREVGGVETIEYSHLAILDHWPRLSEWMGVNKSDEKLITTTNSNTSAEATPVTHFELEDEKPETSYSENRFEEPAPDQDTFIDQAYGQAEILGPETHYSTGYTDYTSKYDKDSDKQFDMPRIYGDNTEDPPYMEKLMEHRQAIDSEEYNEEQFQNNTNTYYSRQSLEPKYKRRSGTKWKFLALGVLLAGGMSLGMYIWPLMQKGATPPAQKEAASLDKSVPEQNKTPESKKKTEAKKVYSKEVSILIEKFSETETEEQLGDDKEWPLLQLLRAFETIAEKNEQDDPSEKNELNLTKALKSIHSSLKLKGHNLKIRHVSFSPNGIFLATASDDNTARVWDLLTGESVAVLEGHTAPVNSANFSPDSKYIVTASEDQSVKIWDVSRGELLETLDKHTKGVNYAVFGAEGKQVATASKDGKVLVWDLASAKVVRSLLGHKGPVNSVAFSTKGNWIATASEDNTARVWDAESGQKMLSISGHKAAVNTVKFNKDSSLLLTSSADNTVVVWQTFSGRKLKVFKGHSAPVVDANFSPDEEAIISTSKNGRALLWDRTSGRVLYDFKTELKGMIRATFSPKGNWIASGSLNKESRILPAQLYLGSKVFLGHSEKVHSANTDSENVYLITASSDKTARLWKIETGEPIGTLKGHTDQVLHGIFDPDQQVIATASKDTTVRTWDFKGEQLKVFQGHQSVVNRVAFSRDGRLLASASNDKTIKIWDRSSGELKSTFEGHRGPVRDVIFSPDGKRLLSSSSDNSIRIWDIEEAKEIKSLKGHNNSVLSIALSPDGKTLASASADKSVRFWDLSNFRQSGKVLVHSDVVTSVVFNDAGNRVITGSYDRVARIWNISSAEILWELKNNGGRVLSVGLSAEGNWALVASENKVKLSRLFSGAELSFYAKTILPRCLSAKERDGLALVTGVPKWCDNLNKIHFRE